MYRRLTLALWLVLLGLVRPVAAHPLPGSLVLLDFGQTSVQARLELPLDQLELAYGKSLSVDPAAAVAREHEALAAYLAAHVRPQTPDGRGWLLRTESLTVQRSANGPELSALMRWIPPDGAPLRRLHLEYDVISHEVVAHQVLITARNDWQRGVFGTAPEPLATLHWGYRALDIDRPQAPWWAAWVGLLRLGAQHIATGTDHLLFLLVLLLPAPLRATRGRWAEPIGLRPTLRHVLIVVSAFTLGHSLTLAAGALHWLRLPGSPVECLIALSILVSAVHATRPLMAGREAWIAAGFGLVHGLAFAETLAELGLDGNALVMAVLGFNLGIEAMQLLVVACVLPWLLWLAPRPIYRPLRLSLAALAGLAALAWLGERALGLDNPFGRALDAGLAALPWPALTVAALLIWAMLVGRGTSASGAARA
jgi:hypothetical protein